MENVFKIYLYTVLSISRILLLVYVVLDTRGNFYVIPTKSFENETLIVVGSRCRPNKFASSIFFIPVLLFVKIRQGNVLKFAPYVQHDYWSCIIVHLGVPLAAAFVFA